jgi:protein gp37
MSNKTIALTWADASWNPVGGCSLVSTGCLNCYAADLAAGQQTAHRISLYLGVTRWKNERPVFNDRLTALPPDHPEWSMPLKWLGSPTPKLGPGKPSIIFVGSMSDIFHEERPPEIVDRILDIAAASDHIGEFFSKRPETMAKYFLSRRGASRPWKRRPLLGFSAERQREFDERWPHARRLAEKGWTTFVSVAPMLGPIVLPSDFLALADRGWVIVGGEQGRKGNVRPMDLAWARSLRDQCLAAGIPFHCYQVTNRAEPPEDLLIQQFPRIE